MGEWISIYDRHPKEFDCVVAYHKEKGATVCIVKYDYTTAEEWNEQWGLEKGDDGYRQEGKDTYGLEFQPHNKCYYTPNTYQLVDFNSNLVTHWMELPNKPKE